MDWEQLGTKKHETPSTPSSLTKQTSMTKEESRPTGSLNKQGSMSREEPKTMSGITKQPSKEEPKVIKPTIPKKDDKKSEGTVKSVNQSSTKPSMKP